MTRLETLLDLTPCNRLSVIWKVHAAQYAMSNSASSWMPVGAPLTRPVECSKLRWVNRAAFPLFYLPSRLQSPQLCHYTSTSCYTMASYRGRTGARPTSIFSRSGSLSSEHESGAAEDDGAGRGIQSRKRARTGTALAGTEVCGAILLPEIQG